MVIIGKAESVLRLSSESVLRLFRVRNLSYDYFEFGICPTPEFGICPTIIPSPESGMGIWVFPWENRQIPIWDGNGNDFKLMGILTCGFLWVSLGFSVGFCGFFCGILWVFPLISCGNGMGMGFEMLLPRQP